MSSTLFAPARIGALAPRIVEALGPPRTRRLSATGAAVGGARRRGQLGGHEQGV